MKMQVISVHLLTTFNNNKPKKGDKYVAHFRQNVTSYSPGWVSFVCRIEDARK